MGNEPLKAAVIGVGSMGQHHARVYNEIPAVELIGVADLDGNAARRVARLRSARPYEDYRQMLRDCQPDLVSIAVPTQFHHQAALDALEAGCHVLVEKPIAATVEQGQEIVARAEALGLKLMVGHIVRFNPAMQALKAQLEAGELGRIFQVRCRRLGPFPTRIQDVGVVIDLATHDLDILSHLISSPVVRLYAETERKIHTAHEDTMIGTVRFANGVIGSLDIDWLTPTKIREVTVTGERGMFLVDDLNQDLYFYENQEANGEQWSNLIILHGVSAGRVIRYPIPRQEPLRIELEAFIQAVRDDLAVPVSGADGLTALRLAQALVQSGQSGEVIQIHAPE
jgi:UDP-N-acetylglucosamine 3-dehydrogenase